MPRIVSSKSDTEPEPREGEAQVVSAVERGLFKSALDFYGAAEAVIDYSDSDRPRLRWDAAGLEGVRDAMAALEHRIGIARRAGFSTERIVRITRLETEVVQQMIERQRAGVTD